jgi:hypothetical protein
MSEFRKIFLYCEGLHDAFFKKVLFRNRTVENRCGNCPSQLTFISMKSLIAQKSGCNYLTQYILQVINQYLTNYTNAWFKITPLILFLDLVHETILILTLDLPTFTPMTVILLSAIQCCLCSHVCMYVYIVICCCGGSHLYSIPFEKASELF